jgi:membrane protein DedA with SNARE-associated domain
VEPVAILGLAGLLFVKEAGLPIPVPGDLLVIGAGVATAADPVAAPVVFGAILVAGLAGGCVQFLLVRGALRRVILDLLVRFGFPRGRLEALATILRDRGAGGVAVARMTPGVRVGTIAACGLAALPLGAFVLGLVAGNAVFVGGHFVLGYVIGPPARDLIAGAGTVTVAIAAFVILAVLGVAGWSMLRRRRSSVAPAPADAGAVGVGVLGSWADAACPACLAIAVVSSVRVADDGV